MADKVNTPPVQPGPASNAPETSVKVRFMPVKATAKGPVFRARIYLQGGLSGLVTTAPIFKDPDKGSYSVGIPGGRFPAIEAANQIVRSGADDYELTSLDPVGEKKLSQWEPKIKTALLAYLHSCEQGKPQPEHVINLG